MVGFHELSDGQRTIVALCAVVRLFEPANFLALAEVQPLIHALLDADQEHGTQLIIASHHPYPFNEMAKDCGIVLSRGEHGRIGWKRFRDVEEYGLSPAELIARGWELNRWQGSKESLYFAKTGIINCLPGACSRNLVSDSDELP